MARPQCSMTVPGNGKKYVYPFNRINNKENKIIKKNPELGGDSICKRNLKEQANYLSV